MNRHFTCTGFIVQGDKTLLLWHPHLRMWVPPGGHLEPDEDPVTAVLREIGEERAWPRRCAPGPHFCLRLPGPGGAPSTILLETAPSPVSPTNRSTPSTSAALSQS